MLLKVVLLDRQPGRRYSGSYEYPGNLIRSRDRTRFGEAVAFVHTGGIYGLFASPDTIAQVL